MNYEILEKEANGGTITARRETRRFLAKEAIALGDWVAWDISQAADGDKFLYVHKASTGANRKACFGVAIDSADAEGIVEVCIAGPVHALVKSTVNAQDALKITGVAGEADITTTNDLDPCIGRALEGYIAMGSGGTLCWVHRKY